MYFYVIDEEKHKIYLSITVGKEVETRDDLKYYYEVHCEKCCEYISFSRNDIVAEQSTGSFPVFMSAILGCYMFGLLYGTIGALIGFIIGIIVGQWVTSKDKYKVETFNNSEG